MERYSLMRPLSLFLAVFALTAATAAADEAKKVPAEKISFHKQIRPIFQAHCQGCHQPAKARGEYVMTVFDKLVAGGDSGKPAIVPGHSAKSYLVELITPVGGKAQMPEGKKPLDVGDIELVRRWIDEGASDDTPANAVQRVDAEH